MASLSVVRRAVPVLVAAASLAVAALPLHAQTAPVAADEDTLYFGQRKEAGEPKFWLAPVHGDLTLLGTYTRSHVSSSDGSDSTVKETHFEEALTLYTNGYIVHPNLVDLYLSVTGGLDQDRLDEDGQSSSANGIVYGWDVSATFLRNEAAPVTVYSRRSESMLDVPFGPTLQTTTTQTGAMMIYRTVNSYAQLEAYHEEDTQSSMSLGNPGYTQKRDEITGNGNSKLSENQELNWNLDLENNTYETGGTTTDEQDVTLGLSHTVTFGDGNRSNLNSSLSYQKQSGEITSEVLRLDERMHLWHTPNFETNYEYAYEQELNGAENGTRQYAEVDARHQLYRSLTTTGRLTWQDLTSDEVDIQTYTENLTLNYQKQVPYGTLFADLSLTHEQQDQSGSGTISVVNQSETFAGLDPITVAAPNAVPSSVVLRDAVTGRVYQEGVDYTVSSNPLGLQIDRTLGGNILAGQPLFLNYEYEPLDATTITSNILALDSRYEIHKGPLAGLTPYARFLGQNQTISGGTATPNDVRDYILGVTYHVHDLTLMGQREWYDSTLFPFEAWRAEARLSHNLSDSTSIASTTTFADFQYHDPEEHTRSYAVNLSLTQRFSTRLTATVYVAYANADSDNGGQTTGVEEGLQANWNYRDTKVYIRVRNSTLNSDVNDREFQFVQIGLTRHF